jgi:pimeloyl-ACP methyl ester carboxylesterase
MTDEVFDGGVGMAGRQPVLVLVHGAAHGAWAWDRVVGEMRGSEVRAVALPSAGTDPGVLGDLRVDAAVVRSAVEAIDGPVVVCAHSYGGVPATEGLAGLGNVRRLVYLCAFQLDIGESVLEVAGGALPDWWEVHEAQGSLTVRDPRARFYADVDGPAADAAIARLGHQSLESFRQPLTAAAWRTVPSTFVVCEQDRAIPPAAQLAMARRSRRVVRMAASHSPFLSRPAEVAAILAGELATVEAAA